MMLLTMTSQILSQLCNDAVRDGKPSDFAQLSNDAVRDDTPFLVGGNEARALLQQIIVIERFPEPPRLT
jgi:hypothetical protein